MSDLDKIKEALKEISSAMPKTDGDYYDGWACEYGIKAKEALPLLESAIAEENRLREALESTKAFVQKLEIAIENANDPSIGIAIFDKIERSESDGAKLAIKKISRMPEYKDLTEALKAKDHIPDVGEKVESEQTGELLPCPFCGGKAELYHAICRTPDPDGTLQGHYVTDCTVCNANVEFETAEEDAIKAWNTRATPDINLDSEELVEEVASAICQSLGGDYKWIKKYESQDGTSTDMSDWHKKHAQAAIKVIKDKQ